MKSMKFLLPTLLMLAAIPIYATTVCHINNDTHMNCAIQTDIKKGYLLTSAPTRIVAGDSKYFDIIGGTDVVVNLDCGNKKVSFETQIDVGIIGQGNIHPKILYIDPGLAINYEIRMGGILDMSDIVWTISVSK